MTATLLPSPDYTGSMPDVRALIPAVPRELDSAWVRPAIHYEGRLHWAHPMSRTPYGGFVLDTERREFRLAAYEFWADLMEVTDLIIGQYRSRLRLRPARGDGPCGWVDREGRSASPAYPSRASAVKGLDELCAVRRTVLILALCNPSAMREREDAGLPRMPDGLRRPFLPTAPASEENSP